MKIVSIQEAIMKIGIFSDTYFPQLNGVATSIRTLATALESRGHQVYIFTPSDPRCHEGYDTHQFITNCWSHLVGFVQNGKSAIFELGINAGGACGKWNFRTDGDKVYDVCGDERREASLEHMQKFINKFDEFETTLYWFNWYKSSFLNE